tara:strand:+ start:338 stop:556 length:219 start_codon:yes stop_codon:yes gene_type:complete
MLKSKTINNFCNIIYKIPSNSKSFCDFSKLNYKGSQKILTPSEYFMKTTSTKEKRRKVIQYFYYKNQTNKIL